MVSKSAMCGNERGFGVEESVFTGVASCFYVVDES
jgi:hypothetical protein